MQSWADVTTYRVLSRLQHATLPELSDDEENETLRANIPTEQEDSASSYWEMSLVHWEKKEPAGPGQKTSCYPENDGHMLWYRCLFSISLHHEPSWPHGRLAQAVLLRFQNRTKKRWFRIPDHYCVTISPPPISGRLRIVIAEQWFDFHRCQRLAWAADFPRAFARIPHENNAMFRAQGWEFGTKGVTLYIDPCTLLCTKQTVVWRPYIITNTLIDRPDPDAGSLRGTDVRRFSGHFSKDWEPHDYRGNDSTTSTVLKLSNITSWPPTTCITPLLS
jgi:hypothetical protein